MIQMLREVLATAAAWALISHPIRTISAATIVATSVFCPTIVSSIAIAQTRAVLAQYEALGRNTVIIEPEPVSYMGEQAPPPLTTAVAERLISRVNHVVSSAVLFKITGQAKACGALVPVTIVGAPPQSMNSLSATVYAGRYISAMDERDGAMRVAIGRELIRELPCVNRDGALDVSGRPMTVVGIVSGGRNGREGTLDRAIIMPARTFVRLYGAEIAPRMVVIEFADGTAVDIGQFEGLARSALKRTPGERLGVQISTFQQIQASASRTGALVRMFVVAVTSIITLAGAVSVSSVIAMSVSERMAEIGLRRALGARRSLVTRQFMLEGAAVTGIGVIGGYALSALAVRVISGMYGQRYTLDWRGGLMAALVAGAMCQVTVWISIRRPLGRDVASILEG